MFNSKVYLSFLLLLPISSLFANEMTALDYLNQLREQAGMIPFQENVALKNSAQNHSNYLSLNRMGGHGESAGRRGFTGQSYVDRILYTGYLSTQTSENVSYHTNPTSSARSIDNLMSAIYHRLAFLDFKFNEIGIGGATSAGFNAYTYNIGSTHKNALCKAQSYNGPDNYINAICADRRFGVSYPSMQRAERVVQEKNPKIVLWPARNSKNIPPAFYEEDPDPLPSYDVSGYPVSLQFNPAKYPRGFPLIHRFEMFRVIDNQKLGIIKKLDQRSDRHKAFKANEHAIFPMKRLDWNTEYRVEVDYQAEDKIETLTWVFKTQSLPMKMYAVSKNTPPILLKEGEVIAIYAAPRGPRDGQGTQRNYTSGGIQLDIQFYDNNTLIVKANGKSGSATISFHGVNVQLALQ